MVDRLRDLQASSPDIEASAVVSVDGLSIASALPQSVEEDRVSAMSAAMLSLGERIATELGRGTLEQVYIKGEYGADFKLPDITVDEFVMLGMSKILQIEPASGIGEGVKV